jgi:hypothetical protein
VVGAFTNIVKGLIGFSIGVVKTIIKIEGNVQEINNFGVGVRVENDSESESLEEFR